MVHLKDEIMNNTLLNKLLKNSSTKYTSILSESELFNNIEIVKTDIPIINVAFSGELDGGMTSGLTIFAGPTKTFKTLLGLICVKAYLNKYPEAICILYDSERGITKEYLLSIGIDPSRILHTPIENLEELKFDMVRQLKEIKRGDKVIFIIDSIGNTASLKEIEDSLSEKTVTDLQRPKVIKSLFRMVTPSLVNKDIPCIAICHTYETMELYSKQIISGGAGLIYSANQAFIISKAQEKEGNGKDKELTGWTFTIHVEKSRYVREKSKFSFKVLFNKGIQKYSGLIDLGIEAGLIDDSSKGWYSHIGEDKKYRLKEIETEEFWTSILKDKSFGTFVRNRYKLLSEYDEV
jgi:RecA/RadA recombinase